MKCVLYCRGKPCACPEKMPTSLEHGAENGLYIILHFLHNLRSCRKMSIKMSKDDKMTDISLK